MNGRKYKRKPTDQVCENCGLVFSAKGIKPHERNCDVDEPFLDPTRDPSRPTTDESGGGESIDPADGEEGHPSEGSPPPTDQAPEAASPDVPAGDIDGGSKADVDAPREGDQEGDIVATTDGGNPAFDAPDPVEVESNVDDDRDSGNDQEATPCPHCDEPIDNWDEIDVGEMRRCGACGEVFKKT